MAISCHPLDEIMPTLCVGVISVPIVPIIPVIESNGGQVATKPARAIAILAHSSQRTGNRSAPRRMTVTRDETKHPSTCVFPRLHLCCHEAPSF